MSRIYKWFITKIAGLIANKVAVGIVGLFAAALSFAGYWVWHRVNPEFVYTAQPSSLPSHNVGLTSVLQHIDEDSQVYCTGGFDQWLTELVWRKCRRFRFEPKEAYRMMVCTRDEKTLSVKTSDQLLALRYFESELRPRECFSILPQAAVNEYVVRLGKDAKFVKLQYANDAPQSTAFCGCSASDIASIAIASGAKLK
jgi:hypothetical protein